MSVLSVYINTETSCRIKINVDILHEANLIQWIKYMNSSMSEPIHVV